MKSAYFRWKIAPFLGLTTTLFSVFCARVEAFSPNNRKARASLCSPIMQSKPAADDLDFAIQPLDNAPENPKSAEKSLEKTAPETKIEPETPAKTPQNDENAPSIVEKLRALAQDLEMMSETDAPFQTFFWAGETELTSAQIAEKAAIDEKTAQKCEKRDLNEFFQNMTSVEKDASDDDKTRAQRFEKLRDFLQNELKSPEIYAFGERAIQIVIVGKIEGGRTGLLTFVVET